MSELLRLDWEVLILTIAMLGAAILVRHLLYCFIEVRYGKELISAFDKYEIKRYKPLQDWFVSGCIVAPVCEEIVFRLPLLVFVRGDIDNILSALLITSVFFAASHFFEHERTEVASKYRAYLVIHAFLMALILGLSLIWTLSIVPAMIIHAGVNAVVLLNIYRRKRLAAVRA